MINDINLLPDKLLYRRRRIAVNIAKGTIILVAASAITYGALYIKLERVKLDKQVSDITASIDSNMQQAVSNAENKLKQKKEEKKKLDEIIAGIPSDSIKITDLMSRVSNLMPAAITAEGMKYAVADRKFEIKLVSGNRADISLFLKRLYDDALFKNVSISPISGKNSPFSFTVMLDLDKTKDNKKQ